VTLCIDQSSTTRWWQVMLLNGKRCVRIIILLMT